MLNEFTVSGITPFGMQPARDVPRRAFNKAVPSLGARGKQQLGKDAMTDAEGNYEIIFTEGGFKQRRIPLGQSSA
jgi:hypothetical protein